MDRGVPRRGLRQEAGAGVTVAVADRPLVVFDGDCAFCTASIDWFTRTFAGSFDAVPYQRSDLVALGLTAAQCQSRLQWLTSTRHPTAAGNRRSGARAVAAMLLVGGRHRDDLVGACARVAGTLASHPPGSWAAAGIYFIVARNRSRMPAGKPTCRTRDPRRGTSTRSGTRVRGAGLA